ncbi:MAG: Uma2 family endonuclease [Acidobacteriota bacterium]
MTFAEFELLPERESGRIELRNGEVVKSPPPKSKHVLIQHCLRNLLANAAGTAGIAGTEWAFRPSTGRDYRVADVAFAPTEQWARMDPDGYFDGAPGLAIEIALPEDLFGELLEKEKLCLENGAREFWIVDIEGRQVKVSTPDGHTITYKSGQQIPLLFGGNMPVDSIFA